MNGSGCKTCPEQYCDCLYRGSYCKARRAEHGLGDPMTNADYMRAMTDEELAHDIMVWIVSNRNAYDEDSLEKFILHYLENPYNT